MRAPRRRLIGSYKRNTAVQDLKDVDILVFIDGEEADYTPTEILDLLRRALNDYPSSESSTRKQTRSVRIRLTDVDVDLDLVPAFGYTSDNSQPLRIPDSDADCWVSTHPLRYEELLTALNQEHDSRVKPLIRLFKVWRNENFVYKKPKSYWLEVLVYDAIRAGLVRPEEGHPQALRDVLKYAVDKLGVWTDLGIAPTLNDPVLGLSITGGWPIEHWQSFVVKLRSALETADRALAETDDAKAAEQWAKLFGEAWPEDAEAKSALYNSILAGTASVSSAGAVFAQKPAAAQTHPFAGTRAFGGSDE